MERKSNCTHSIYSKSHKAALRKRTENKFPNCCNRGRGLSLQQLTIDAQKTVTVKSPHRHALSRDCSAFHENEWFRLLGYTPIMCVDFKCERCAVEVPYPHHLFVSWVLWLWEQFDGDFAKSLGARVTRDSYDKRLPSLYSAMR